MVVPSVPERKLLLQDLATVPDHKIRPAHQPRAHNPVQSRKVLFQLLLIPGRIHEQVINRDPEQAYVLLGEAYKRLAALREDQEGGDQLGAEIDSQEG